MSTLLRGATLIDGRGGAPVPGADVLMDDGRFVSVGPMGSFPVPPDVQAVDLSGKWLLPGMIDLHVHPYWPKGGLTDNPVHEGTAYAALAAAANLRTTLQAGITTVRDVGPNGDFAIALRTAVARGVVPGSRVFTCVRFIAQTGGHGGDLEADGPFEVRRAIRTNWKAGADFIKIAVNGASALTEYTREELDAAVDEAHRLNLRVSCHASILQPARMAVDAGVDTIEHGCQLDELLAKKMADKGIVLVPTLKVYLLLLEISKKPGAVEPGFAEAIRHRSETHRRAFEIALKAGVKIGSGTDMVIHEHTFAALPEELAAMVAYGMPPMQAIQAATSVAADALGKADRLGTIEPGKLADCIVLGEDPLKDIGAMGRVGDVFKEGKRVLRG
jgi:imidazolonepropionase-like amidohydrolase